MTKQRQVIYDIIKESCLHLTAEEIFATAKSKLPSISIGTIYRNLGQMVKEGLIQKIAVANGPDHYDKTIAPHFHAACVRCKKVFDVMQSDEFSLPNIINGSLPVLDIDLTIHSICKKCSKRKTRKTKKSESSNNP